MPVLRALLLLFFLATLVAGSWRAIRLWVTYRRPMAVAEKARRSILTALLVALTLISFLFILQLAAAPDALESWTVGSVATTVFCGLPWLPVVAVGSYLSFLQLDVLFRLRDRQLGRTGGADQQVTKNAP